MGRVENERKGTRAQGETFEITSSKTRLRNRCADHLISTALNSLQTGQEMTLQDLKEEVERFKETHKHEPAITVFNIAAVLHEVFMRSMGGQYNPKDKQQATENVYHLLGEYIREESGATTTQT